VVRLVVQAGSIIHDMAKEKSKPKRSRGQIETLPSGSLRVSLYAGTDPVTKDRM
jgi:integrase